MTLQDWCSSGWLLGHETSAEEIRGMLAVADRDLRDAASENLSDDWRFNIAYNAALQLAGAALAAAGFRVSRGGSHHHHTVHSLAHTIGADESTVRLLDRFRRKRNVAEYEAAGTVSEGEVAEMLGLADNLRDRVIGWLRSEHPRLLDA
jgi:hypothetical protein